MLIWSVYHQKERKKESRNARPHISPYMKMRGAGLPLLRAIRNGSKYGEAQASLWLKTCQANISMCVFLISIPAIAFARLRDWFLVEYKNRHSTKKKDNFNLDRVRPSCYK